MERGIAFAPWTVYQSTIVDGFRLKQGGAHFGVSIFFLVSGYIISHVAQSESRREFVVKRAFRLLPTLFIAAGAMAIGTGAASRFGLVPMLGDEAQNLRDYLMSAIMLNFPVDRRPLALAVTWSLWAEVLFYALVVAVIPLIKGRPVGATWVLTAAEVILVLPYKASADLSYLGYFSIYLPLFVVGRIFYLDHTRRIAGREAVTLLAANLLVFSLMYEYRFPGLLLDGPYGAIWTYILSGIMFYALMVSGIRRVPKILDFLANISYALYLLHLPVGSLVMSVGYALGFAPIWLFAAGASTSVLAAFLVTRIVERPMNRFARDLIKRGVSPKNPEGALPGHALHPTPISSLASLEDR